LRIATIRQGAAMSLLSNIKALLRPSKVDVRARFEILHEAMSGTMSAFYKARDRQTDQIVGLKLLDPEKTAALEARFVGLNRPCEGAIAVQFNHPHIVRTQEHGLTTQNQQYLLMEFLDGPGLNSLLVEQGPKLDGKRLALARQAAEAVAAVHAAGFIHRDICPRNFVLARDLASLKLIDFGLTVPATAPFMQPGNRTGTPNYMAPELVRRKKADQRLDIFAFGVTLFELFTYELPWPRGSTGQAAMSHGVVPPTDIRKLRPTIDPQLAAAIHACLEAEAERRPRSMQDVLELIRGVKGERA
jgi:serine/threonine-protein kinase